MFDLVKVGVYAALVSCAKITIVLTMSGRIGDLSEEQSKALTAFKSEVTQEFVTDDVR